MPQTDSRSKTNALTIYMIKPEIQRLEDIVSTAADPLEIDGVGHFYSEDSHTRIPKWVRDFFGDALGSEIKIFNASSRGMLIVPIKSGEETIYFAVTFGVGRFLLREGVTEERFGLRVVLNSASEDSFRSIDKTNLGSVTKHTREEMSRDVAPAEFGIDIEQDLISSVTAASRDPVFGNRMTGRDSLHVSVRVDKRNIVDFLLHCFDRYRSEDYKANFEWIDQIAEVRNRRIEEALNSALVERINGGQLDKIWMAVPEIINWSDVSGFRYKQQRRGDLKEDLDVSEFVATFDGAPIDLDALKKSDVFAISVQTDSELVRWPAFRCLYAEIELEGKVYVLNSGKWYEIARDFTDQVQQDFNGMPEANVQLPDYISGDELAYNQGAAVALGGACCMDQKVVQHGGGHGKVEFCDVLTADGKIIHVKKYGGSGVLSHLFAQGVVSGELFASDGEFRRKLNDKLPTGYKLADPAVRPDLARQEIVYAIISKSTDPLDIPFFSKVSLRNARRRLQGLGYSVAKKKILKVESPVPVAPVAVARSTAAEDEIHRQHEPARRRGHRDQDHLTTL